MATDSRPVIFLMGPTASGKTDLAVALQQQLPVEIISVDSAMVFRGMDIGTAKPGPDILEQAPHHLIDICDPGEIYSAGRFREDALALIEEIHQRHRIPLLTGGTGLYFRTLEQGISDIPAADPGVRERLERRARIQGWDVLHQYLATVDPQSARRIHSNDPQRIQRALEVFELTGKPLSEWFAGGRLGGLPYPVIKLIISPAERSVIHERVKQRFHAMIELGLVNEVTKLYERGDLTPDSPSMRMVGYRQVWRYLDGRLDYQEMIERAIVATRQLAKRQMTWLRSERNCAWFDSCDRRLEAGVVDAIVTDHAFNI